MQGVGATSCTTSFFWTIPTNTSVNSKSPTTSFLQLAKVRTLAALAAHATMLLLLLVVVAAAAVAAAAVAAAAAAATAASTKH